ncbi:MAG TPA: SRPBCC family protein [Candidatus Limnocylindrales bacterium]|nr:SRPBCC family protein [Candidatus Limnocylindrales bacterium]
MSTAILADDPTVVGRILEHIDHRTTDLGRAIWREPVDNYRSAQRYDAELALLRRLPSAFCPSAALPTSGSYVARRAAGTPILAVRGEDGSVQAFRNACRHRGAQLVDGAGCEKAFVCRYHGWTYGLSGNLRHVPHEHGFPGLDKGVRGLVPVKTVETSGIVFVTQNEPVAGAPDSAASAASLTDLIPSRFRCVGPSAYEGDVAANWKIMVEGFLEGYHIRSTHRGTFYPLQFDNLNVVEHFGDNTRIAFPYKSIHRMREVAPPLRSAEGTLTYVYHLFPNTMVATFPGRIFLVSVEPLSIDSTRLVTYMLTDHSPDDADAAERITTASQLVDAGAAEDREVACAIQRGLATGANDFFEFGLFESAIGHFHRTLHAALETAARSAA